MKLLMFAVAACLLAIVQVLGQDVPKSNLKSLPALTNAPANKPGIKGQINGGTTVTARGQYPWMTSIYADGGYICTGSMINYQYILTAASCVIGRTNLTVRIGVKRMLNDVFEDGANQYDTITKFIHPNYTATGLANNIAIVKYNIVVGTSAVVGIIGLPKYSEANRTFDATNATLSGWGATFPGGPYLQDLQTVDLPVIANPVCATTYGTTYVTPSVMCTKSATNSNGACAGDEGAPLVYKDSTAKWTQIGIMSFNGPNCTHFPQGYTRVASYLNWIKSVTAVYIAP